MVKLPGNGACAEGGQRAAKILVTVSTDHSGVVSWPPVIFSPIFALLGAPTPRPWEPVARRGQGLLKFCDFKRTGCDFGGAWVAKLGGPHAEHEKKKMQSPVNPFLFWRPPKRHRKLTKLTTRAAHRFASTSRLFVCFCLREARGMVRPFINTHQAETRTDARIRLYECHKGRSHSPIQTRGV